MSKPAPVEIGQRFGALVVVNLRQGPRQPNGRASGRLAVVRCDCGREVTMPARKLARSSKATCGHCSGKAHRPAHGIPGYVAAHRAIVRARGKASEYRCAVCGGPAAQWALDLATSGPLYADLSGQNAGLVYSTAPDAYAPLCASCHRQIDGSMPASVRAAIRQVVEWDTRHEKGSQ